MRRLSRLLALLVVVCIVAAQGVRTAHAQAQRESLAVLGLTQPVEVIRDRWGINHIYAWGDEKLHHVLIKHPMSAAVNDETRKKLEVGSFPRGGDGTTVSATGGQDNQAIGGSLKIVADTENWDNSVGLNTPGQSGNPDEAHYRDLFDLWARGRYFPVAYSRAKVESVAERTSTLTPAAPATSGRQ